MITLSFVTYEIITHYFSLAYCNCASPLTEAVHNFINTCGCCALESWFHCETGKKNQPSLFLFTKMMKRTALSFALCLRIFATSLIIFHKGFLHQPQYLIPSVQMFNCSFHFASPAFSQFGCLPDPQLLIFAISAEMGAGAACPVVGIREKWARDLLINLK